ncbi:MAG TPA: hypothetical protein ENH91_01600 [Leeuwenhoekiella sp.]|nr:hypothetical protein [Leeuwenhoekiella sp.]
MRNFYFYLLVLLSLTACGEKKKDAGNTIDKMAQNKSEMPDYPNDLTAVFDAHGGIDVWATKQTLHFEIGEGDDKQVHTVDLHTRKSLTQAANYTLGFDVEKAWLVQDSTYMKPERAQYMHNLMFYFLAMPFVLGDPGINYSPADTLQFDGKKYPGIKIIYDNGIGVSDKDEYILYSDPDIHKMSWLAYTATFGNEERATNFSYIKYDQWQDVDGVLLPTSLQWYKVADGQPTEMRNEQVFKNISLSPSKEDDKMYEKPENGTYTDNK